MNCRKYTRCLHKSEVKPLKWYEILLMKYHYFVCRLCKIYTFENQLLNQKLLTEKENIIFPNTDMSDYRDKIFKRLNL